ncbi:MAG: multiple sugar transport system ATP-binding protein [Candidatus Binatia bacterium]|jgi:multiple sugar transport system ATP-binding protein
MASLSIENLSRSFPGHRGGAPVRALRGLSLEVKDGELLSIVGPSGCGKTTLLRLIAGLEAQDNGEIAIDGRSANSLPPQDRDIAMVFQNHALYPHMTAQENLGCGLKWRGAKSNEIAARVEEIAQVMGLGPCLDRLPEHLSGGQRQRVALGRAAVLRPRIFLFDEPLAHLDAEMRLQLRREIMALNRRTKATVIHVTHDQAEALAMGDRVAVLREGALQQIDAPEAVYQAPANKFVAGFIGSPPMNFIEGRIVRENDTLLFEEAGVEGGSREGKLRFELKGNGSDSLASRIGSSVNLGLRPEAIVPVSADDLPAGAITISDRVQFVEFYGDARFVTLESGLTAKSDGAAKFTEGGGLSLRINVERPCFFDSETERAIF